LLCARQLRKQLSGIGRFQRNWISHHSQNIYATFYFQLPRETLHIQSLGQILALSFAKVLIKEGINPEIKWPNDLMLNRKKIGGVLAEVISHKNFFDVFLGIGVNVNMGKEELSIVDNPDSSLQIETTKHWNEKHLLEELKQELKQDLEIYKKEGFSPFHNPFENLMAYKGEKITCYDQKKSWTGICHSVTADGQLNLCMDDGSIETLSSAEISFRPITS